MNKQHLLIEAAYPGGREAFDTYVTARIQAGTSWRTIAAEVNGWFNGGVTVSHEWLRTNYRDGAAA